MGIPDEPFWAPPELVQAYRDHAAGRGEQVHGEWSDRFAAADIDHAAWEAAWQQGGTKDWDADLPVFEQGEKVATRVRDREGVQRRAGRSARLRLRRRRSHRQHRHQARRHTRRCRSRRPAGRQIHFGVREHAMGSTMVGMSAHGGVLPAGGTFFVFLDYMRPPVRLASITGTKVFFVFTHDSVGVGEDGPTHQPVEQLATLRAIPQLQVIRPADANETVAALRAAVAHEGPTAFVLSRQNITVCTDGSAVERGAGVVVAEDDPQVVLVGTGSEVAAVRRRRRPARRRRGAHPRRQPAVVGSLRGAVGRTTATRCCRPACRCCRSRPASRSAGRAGPTPRSASTASASAPPAPRCSTSSASTSTTSSSAPRQLIA